MFRHKPPTGWFTRKIFCLLLLSLTVSFIGWRADAERWRARLKTANLDAVTAKAKQFRHTTLSPRLLSAKAYGGLTVLHISTEQELRDALTATSGAQNGDTVIFDANITLSRDLPAVQNSITLNGNGHFLDGAGAYRGLFVYAGVVTISEPDDTARRCAGRHKRRRWRGGPRRSALREHGRERHALWRLIRR